MLCWTNLIKYLTGCLSCFRNKKSTLKRHFFGKDFRSEQKREKNRVRRTQYFFASKLPDGFDNLGMFLEHERRDGHVLQLVEQVEGSRHVRVVEAERLLHLVVDVRQALFKFEPRHLKKKSELYYVETILEFSLLQLLF